MLNILPDKLPEIHLRGGCWPTTEQTLLLRAALLEAPEAFDAWEAWSEGRDLDDLDSGSVRLLGLLYRNLLRMQVDPSHPLLPKLKGVYRLLWTKNQVVLGTRGGLLRLFQAHAIPCLILKGAALTLLAYEDFGVRPMDDLDLLIPLDRVPEAMDMLEREGWKSEVKYSRELTSSVHACSFRNRENLCIDLHWRMSHLPVSEEFDERLWLHPLEVSIQGVAAKTPCWTAQFLHCCAHGPQYKSVSPFRWLADASMILRKGGGEIDWDDIRACARPAGATHGVRETLRYLCQHLDAKLPPEAEPLLNLRVPLRERIENHFLSRPLPTPLHRLPLDFSHYWRCSRGLPLGERLSGFKLYFRHVNNLWPGQFTQHYGAAAKRWFRVWLPWHLRNLHRSFLKRDPGCIGSIPVKRLQNFHELEPRGRQMLRWSRPNAAVLLELPQTHRFRIELDLGNLRTWKTDLSEHLRFTFDGVPLDEVNVTSKKPLLRLEIPEFTELPKSGRLYKLEWTCHKVFPSPDPRPLGLPVLSVHARGLGKRASTDHSDPDHAPSQVSTPTCSAPHHG